MLNFGSHIGSSVSALVDGQLAEHEAERAWSHVLTCPSCRRLVEREGWVKRQLATMGGNEPPERLLGSLYQLDPAQEAWAAVDELERKGRGRRRAGLALAGAGSVSAAVFGIATLGGAGLGIGGAPAGTPPATTTGSTPTSTPTTADVAPAITIHGRVPQVRDEREARRGVVLLERD